MPIDINARINPFAQFSPMTLEFKSIQPVPLSTHLIDIVLSTTQRQTPTVIHSHFPIQKIRNFYIRKIKHTSTEFTERFKTILIQFPHLEDIHPFYADLINVLYDKDHYKMALGHVNTINKVVQDTSKEFQRLLKFGDSLYRCKHLKKAALGRMASAAKKLKGTLEYLEEVRQHMSRLPSIDLAIPTIVLCGHPNVGKSSLMNKVSNAHVEVQPYPFTTKNLYVGHFDYKNTRYQLIDTPGVLDHDLSERNTIEMQSIVALAHLKSIVLFFIDISESCGFSIGEQISLFESFSSLENRFIIVLSKSDLVKVHNLDYEGSKALECFLQNKDWIDISSRENHNIEGLKSLACSFLHQENPECSVIFKPETLKPKEKAPSAQKSQERDASRTTKPPEPLLVPEFYNGKNVSDMICAEVPTEVVLDREYDVLDEETENIKNTIENERKAKLRKHVDLRRASVPLRWKGRGRRKDFVPVVEMKSRKSKKEVLERKVQKPINKNPKHLYRGKSKHGKR